MNTLDNEDGNEDETGRWFFQLDFLICFSEFLVVVVVVVFHFPMGFTSSTQTLDFAAV